MQSGVAETHEMSWSWSTQASQTAHEKWSLFQLVLARFKLPTRSGSTYMHFPWAIFHFMTLHASVPVAGINILTQIHTQIQVADFIPNLSFQLWIWASAMGVLEHIGPNIEGDKFSKVKEWKRDRQNKHSKKKVKSRQTTKNRPEVFFPPWKKKQVVST